MSEAPQQKSFLDVLVARPHEPALGPMATSQAAARSVRHATASIRLKIMEMFRRADRREDNVLIHAHKRKRQS